MLQTTQSGAEISSKGKTKPAGAKKQGKSRTGRKAASKSAPADVVAMKSVAKYLRYAALEARQKAVERSKRAVYAHLNKIANAHINLAAKGNCQSAKFLFEFAGIDDMSLALGAIESRCKTSISSASDDDPRKAVLSFYQKLGITPPKLKPPVSAATPAEEAPALAWPCKQQAYQMLTFLQDDKGRVT